MGESSTINARDPGKVIPLFDARSTPVIGAPLPLSLAALDEVRALAKLTDPRQRRLHDLRISVTDKCNFRCTYCMPKDVFGPGYKDRKSVV